MTTWAAGLLQTQGAQARYAGLRLRLRQHQCELQRLADGIPLKPVLAVELKDLARRSGVPLPFALADPLVPI